MGTSTSFGGPVGKNPLLPDWAQEENPENKEQIEQGEATEDVNDDSTEEGEDSTDKNVSLSKEKDKLSRWGEPKKYMGKYAQTRDRRKLRSAAKSYVKSLGGKRGASSSAKNGKKAIAGLGSFLSHFASQGLDTALKSVDLSSLIGASAELALTAVVDSLAPAGFDNDTSSARKAITVAIEELIISLDINNEITSDIDSLSEETMKDIVLKGVETYIYSKWLRELGLAVEKKSLTESDACRVEEDAKELISECVKYDFEDKDLDILKLDFNSPVGKQIIDEIFEDAYSLIEAL